jgi:predicted dehydrogenase
MVRVGIIGQGFIGKMHLATLRKGGLAEVVAVADRNPANLAGNAATEGNIALEGDVSLEGVATYGDADELLRDSNVEAVLIALPTFLHKPCVLKAIEAGKHILCEKPLALNADEGREVVAALRGYDKAFMVAQCIRFWPPYVKAREFVRGGEYGRLLTAQFTRMSPKPGWSHEGWLHDERRSGGALLDLHIHDVDYVNFLLGRPARITARGRALPGEGIGEIHALYTYDDGAVVAIDGGWLHPPTFPFRMSFRIALEQATLEFNSQTDGLLHVHTGDGRDLTPELEPGDGYLAEQAYFLRCVERGEKPELASAESALVSLELVEAEQAAVLDTGVGD